MTGTVEALVGFTHALRAAGVPVTQDRTRAYLDAAALIGLTDPSGVYTAGRATLCGSPDDLARHDQVFAEWFAAARPAPGVPAPVATPAVVELPEAEDAFSGEAEGDPVRARASATEVLRHRDAASLSVVERARLAALLAGLPVRLPNRRTPRLRPAVHGRVDPSRTLRESLRRMGEPGRIRWRARGVRPRRVVLLVDVSGSMSAYAEVLLRLAHRIVVGGGSAGGSGLGSAVGSGVGSGGRTAVEVFSLGTRLTHLTPAMRSRDVDRALAAAGRVVPDWSGGTRLGETLQAFLDRRRDLARGAVVVVFSDGWERGETTLLAEQSARLRRLAHRVVWVNPHRGKAGYEPVQAGVLAVLPFVDDFLAGHSLATYQELIEVIAHA